MPGESDEARAEEDSSGASVARARAFARTFWTSAIVAPHAMNPKMYSRETDRADRVDLGDFHVSEVKRERDPPGGKEEQKVRPKELSATRLGDRRHDQDEEESTDADVRIRDP